MFAITISGSYISHTQNTPTTWRMTLFIRKQAQYANSLQKYRPEVLVNGVTFLRVRSIANTEFYSRSYEDVCKVLFSTKKGFYLHEVLYCWSICLFWPKFLTRAQIPSLPTSEFRASKDVKRHTIPRSHAVSYTKVKWRKIQRFSFCSTLAHSQSPTYRLQLMVLDIDRLSSSQCVWTWRAPLMYQWSSLLYLNC